MTYMNDQFRTESDSMGPMQIPASAYYGAQTARAVENFPISNLRFPRSFIRALGLIKKHAALTNQELGGLKPPRGRRHRPGRPGGGRRKVGRGICAGHFPDRLRHFDQHERQRGHRQPRHRVARRQTRRQTGSSQRPRQPRAIQQRRHSHGDSPGRAGGDGTAA